jgi:hypothetical protein
MRRKKISIELKWKRIDPHMNRKIRAICYMIMMNIRWKNILERSLLNYYRAYVLNKRIFWVIIQWPLFKLDSVGMPIRRIQLLLLLLKETLLSLLDSMTVTIINELNAVIDRSWLDFWNTLFIYVILLNMWANV